MPSESFSDVKEVRWIASNEDVNRLRRFSFRNHIGDSAYAIRRVLDLAEEMERLGRVGEHGKVKQMDDRPLHEREHLVHPVRAAERAIEALAAGFDKGAIAELAHGLASLGKQHNDLSERVETLERAQPKG